MALPATDAFTRGDSSDLGTNWDVIYGAGHQVVSNTCGCNTGEGDGYDGAEMWNADSFDNDQYVVADVSGAPSSGGATGVAVRCASQNFYGLYSDSLNKYIFRVVGGSFTTMDSDANAWSDTDEVGLDVEGTTLTPKLNGSTDTDLGAKTDSNLSSGAAGVSGYGVSNYNYIDNWEGGNLSAGISVPVAVMHLRQQGVG